MTCRLRSRAPHSDGPEEKSWAIVIDHQTKCGRLFSLFGILEVPSRSFACMRSRRVFSPTARSSRGAERTGRRFRLAAWRGKCRAGSSTKPRQSEGHSSETWNVRIGVRGGPGRIRTSNQTVMSELLRLRKERIFPAYETKGLKVPAMRFCRTSLQRGQVRGSGRGAPESPSMSRNVVRGLNI
jgi:hypothetical protein